MSGPDDIRALAEGAVARASAAPDKKRPLLRGLPSPPEYPSEALLGVQAAAEAVRCTTQAPFPICAQSVLAAAALVTQPHFDIVLPRMGRRPLTALFASIARSGERKTAVDRIVLAGVQEQEDEWRERAEISRYRSRNELEVWEAKRGSAKKQWKSDPAKLAEELDKIGPEPKPEPSPMLLVADPTPEGLIMHLGQGRPWGGVFTSEAGLLVWRRGIP
jgi:hypothetical protein